MYVCLCNNVTEHDIGAAVAAGARTFDCLEEQLAVATCCGCCRDLASEILSEYLHGAEPQPGATAVPPRP